MELCFPVNTRGSNKDLEGNSDWGAIRTKCRMDNQDEPEGHKDKNLRVGWFETGGREDSALEVHLFWHCGGDLESMWEGKQEDG